jgi:hypothetical protein
MQWPEEIRLVLSCAALAKMRHLETFQNRSERQTELERLLRSHTDEEIARGLFICGGVLLHFSELTYEARALTVPLKVVEQYLFRENPALWVLAAWVFGAYHFTPSRRLTLSRPRTGPNALLPSRPALDRLLTLWSGDVSDEMAGFVGFALSSQFGLVPRGKWTPKLTETQMARVQQASVARDTPESEYQVVASLVVAFHAGNVWPEEELAMRVDKSSLLTISHQFLKDAFNRTLKQMGHAGRKYLNGRR